jgi:hypothetical protein
VRDHERLAAFPSEIDVGRILSVGVGSVATSVLYGLALVGAHSTTICVDGDTFKIENLARSLACSFRDDGLAKPTALARGLNGSSVRVLPRTLWWDEYTTVHPEEAGTCDVWLPLANERNVRHSLQTAIPPLMIHGSTTGSWGCSFGRHLPGRGDCLAERFPAGSVQGPMKCASGPIPLDDGEKVDAALPFMSLAAGALVVGDLVRLQMAGYPQVPNMVNIDFKGTTIAPQRFERAPSSRCPYCSVNFAAELRSATRYARLYGRSE